MALYETRGASHFYRNVAILCVKMSSVTRAYDCCLSDDENGFHHAAKEGRRNSNGSGTKITLSETEVLVSELITLRSQL